MLLRQLRNGEAKVENQYKRVVPWEGNRAALRAMAEVFELRPYFEWRGLGFISQSALRIRDDLCRMGRRAALHSPRHPRHRSQGRAVRRSAQRRAEARAMQAFRQASARPNNPVGALMVSSEGSCAAYYNYEHRKTGHHRECRDALNKRESMATAVTKIDSATRRSKCRTAPAARPAAGWSKDCSLRCFLVSSTDPLADAAHIQINGTRIADDHG